MADASRQPQHYPPHPGGPDPHQVDAMHRAASPPPATEPPLTHDPAADQAPAAAPGRPHWQEHPDHPLAVNTEMRRTLRTLRVVGIVLAVIALVGAVLVGLSFFERSGDDGDQSNNTPVTERPPESPVDEAQVSTTGDGVKTISCLSAVGPDATTQSQQFKEIEGTQCTYRTGDQPETLVLNGKLTGRNTEGTGMSVTLNVNGLDCNGGETLNYAQNWTPMFGNCTFELKPNQAVVIQWRFLSPFGGTASVLRSSQNIAPSINGVAVPKGS